MKVYCNECKFLKMIHHEDTATKKRTIENRCLSPRNTKVIDSPMGRKEILESTPEAINNLNACEWFGASRPKSPKEERGPTVGMKTILDHEKRLVAIENRIFKKKKEAKDGKTTKADTGRTSDPSGPREPDSGVGAKEETGKAKK